MRPCDRYMHEVTFFFVFVTLSLRSGGQVQQTSHLKANDRPFILTYASACHRLHSLLLAYPFNLPPPFLFGPRYLPDLLAWMRRWSRLDGQARAAGCVCGKGEGRAMK